MVLGKGFYPNIHSVESSTHMHMNLLHSNSNSHTTHTHLTKTNQPTQSMGFNALVSFRIWAAADF